MSRPTAWTRQASPTCANYLESIAEQGTTIVVASHILTELERTAHTVAVLAEGRLAPKQCIRTILDNTDGGLETFYQASVRGDFL